MVCHLVADTTVRQTFGHAAELQRQVITGGTGHLLAVVETGAGRRGTSLTLFNLSTSAVCGRGTGTSLRTTDANEPRSPCGAVEPAASPVRLPRIVAEKFVAFYHEHNRS